MLVLFFLIVMKLFFFLTACADIIDLSYCLCGYCVCVFLRAAISRTSSRTSPTRCTRWRRRPAGPPPRATRASSCWWSRRPSATSMQVVSFHASDEINRMFSSSRAFNSSTVANAYCNRAPLLTHLFRTDECTRITHLFRTDECTRIQVLNYSSFNEFPSTTTLLIHERPLWFDKRCAYPLSIIYYRECMIGNDLRECTRIR